MLFQVILLPSAFSSPPPNDEAAAFFYPAGISFLQDLLENCILLIDPRVSNDGIPAIVALSDAIREWPEQFKIRAQRVLSMLEKKKRFHAIRTQYNPEDRCPLAHCKHAIAVGGLMVNQRIVVLAGGACIACSITI